MTAPVSLHRLPRRVATVVLALAVVMTLLPLLAKPAQAAAQYQSRGFGCERTAYGRRVLAYPPNLTASGSELQMVYYSPDLYRWNGRRWALYDGTRGWNHAVATTWGVRWNAQRLSYWFTPQNHGLQFVVYNNLPRGKYKVVDHYRWGATDFYRPSAFVVSKSVWAPYVGGAGYCHFAS